MIEQESPLVVAKEEVAKSITAMRQVRTAALNEDVSGIEASQDALSIALYASACLMDVTYASNDRSKPLADNLIGKYEQYSQTAHQKTPPKIQATNMVNQAYRLQSNVTLDTLRAQLCSLDYLTIHPDILFHFSNPEAKVCAPLSCDYIQAVFLQQCLVRLTGSACTVLPVFMSANLSKIILPYHPTKKECVVPFVDYWGTGTTYAALQKFLLRIKSTTLYL